MYVVFPLLSSSYSYLRLANLHPHHIHIYCHLRVLIVSPPLFYQSYLRIHCTRLAPKLISFPLQQKQRRELLGLDTPPLRHDCLRTHDQPHAAVSAEQRGGVCDRENFGGWAALL